MLSRVLALLLLAFALQTSAGNPRVLTHPVYISAERLDVKLLHDAAVIDGLFHFRSTAGPNDPGAKSSMEVDVPIWVPRNPREADSATAALLRACEVSRVNYLKGDLQTAWDSAIGLKIQVGDQQLKIEHFSVFDPRSAHDEERLPKEWFHQDYYCVLVGAKFRPELLTADPEIRIQYRQGLRQTGAGAEFHYLPVFWNMPKDQTTRELKRYCMYLVNDSGLPGKLGAASVPNGYSLVLPLAHHEPIGISLKAKD